MTRNDLRDAGRYLALAILVGAASAVAANIFVQGPAMFSALADTIRPLLFAISLHHPGWQQSVLLCFAGVLILSVRRAFGVTAWSGPAESMFALQYRRGPALDVKIGAGSVLAAFVACGCGAPVGQYGPAIHLGATVSQGLRNTIKRKLRPDIMLTCGISAAITGAFNAPLAAMVFAFEVMLRQRKLSVFLCVAVAVAVAYALNLTLFQHQIFLPVSIIEVGFVDVALAALTAPICAALAALYIKSLLQMQRWGQRLPTSLGINITVCAMVCAGAGAVVPELLGIGQIPLQQALTGAFSVTLLCVLLLGKIALTSFCIASGFYGGIFAPALFIGAIAGVLLAQVLSLLGVGDWTGLLLLNVMAGVAAAVIGAPVTVTLLVMELTGSSFNGVLVIATAYASTWLTRRFFTASYYQLQLNDIVSTASASSKS